MWWGFEALKSTKQGNTSKYVWKQKQVMAAEDAQEPDYPRLLSLFTSAWRRSLSVVIAARRLRRLLISWVRRGILCSNCSILSSILLIWAAETGGGKLEPELPSLSTEWFSIGWEEGFWLKAVSSSSSRNLSIALRNGIDAEKALKKMNPSAKGEGFIKAKGNGWEVELLSRKETRTIGNRRPHIQTATRGRTRAVYQ